MRWPELKLSQIVDRFISGGTPSTKNSEYWYGDIPWITGADFSDGEVVLGRRYINEEAIENSATNIVPAGSILMVTRTGVGKIAIAPVDIAISQDITGIVLKEGINHRFIVSAVRHRMGMILSVQRGATIKGVTRGDVERLPVPVPAPSEQRRIVEILDQADALRKKRADADAKAKRILPVLFYKMFGDPTTNPKEWDVTNLSNGGSSVRYGLGQPPEADPDGIPLIRATNIRRGMISEEDMMFVSHANVPKTRNAFLTPDEVIVVRSGAYTGDVAQVTERWAGSVAGYDLIVTPGEGFYGEFIEAFLLTPHIQKNYFGNLKARAGQPHLNASQLSATPILRPPKDLQLHFAQQVRNIRQLLNRIAYCQQKLDALFSVLLSRSFSGELTAKWRESHMKELLIEMEEQTKALRNIG